MAKNPGFGERFGRGFGQTFAPQATQSSRQLLDHLLNSEERDLRKKQLEQEISASKQLQALRATQEEILKPGLGLKSVSGKRDRLNQIEKSLGGLNTMFMPEEVQRTLMLERDQLIRDLGIKKPKEEVMSTEKPAATKSAGTVRIKDSSGKEWEIPASKLGDAKKRGAVEIK